MSQVVAKCPSKYPPKRPWPVSETLKNFWVDIVLFVAFVVDMDARFTGLAIHEWLGIGIGVAFVYHLLLHWKWIVSITTRLFKRLPPKEPINYLLNLLLFVDMVVLILTGIWISEVAARQVGLSFANNLLWARLHHLTADWAIWLVGLHLAFNWKWIANAFARYLWRPLRGKQRSTQTKPAFVTAVQMEGGE